MATLLLLNHSMMSESTFILSITVFGACLSLLKSVLVMTYFGHPWKRTDYSIDPDDWRAQVIIILAGINILLLSLSLAYDPKWYKMITIAILFLIIRVLSNNTGSKDSIDSLSHHVIFCESCITLVVIFVFLLWTVFRRIKRQ